MTLASGNQIYINYNTIKTVKTTDKASIHRFHDKVAISLPGQPTSYFSEEFAWKLGNALKEAAADISKNKRFADSAFTTKEVVEDSAPEDNSFTVIAVSNNTNAFGLKSILLLSPSGEGWKILKSPYGSEVLPQIGDVLERVNGRFPGSYECPTKLPSVDAKTAAGLIKGIKP